MALILLLVNSEINSESYLHGQNSSSTAFRNIPMDFHTYRKNIFPQNLVG